MSKGVFWWVRWRLRVEGVSEGTVVELFVSTDRIKMMGLRILVLNI